MERNASGLLLPAVSAFYMRDGCEVFLFDAFTLSTSNIYRLPWCDRTSASVHQHVFLVMETAEWMYFIAESETEMN